MASWGGGCGGNGKFRGKQEPRRHRWILIEDGEGAGWNWQQEVTLSFHPCIRQSRVVCKSDAERGNGNSVTAEKGKQPGELLSGQMDSQVTGHQISHTVPHKAAGWH